MLFNVALGSKVELVPNVELVPKDELVPNAVLGSKVELVPKVGLVQDVVPSPSLTTEEDEVEVAGKKQAPPAPYSPPGKLAGTTLSPSSK